MKKFIVYLWCGCGYSLTPFETLAFSEEEALCNVCVELISENMTSYFMEEEAHSNYCSECLHLEDELEDESSIYVDATMEGADRPIWVNAENMKIVEA